MATIPGLRFRSDERCAHGGWFEFDGYLDGSSELLPPLNELEVSLAAGQRFPRVTDERRACYWRIASGAASFEESAARGKAVDVVTAGCNRVASFAFDAAAFAVET